MAPKLSPAQQRISEAHLALEQIQQELNAAKAAHDLDKVVDLLEKRDDAKWALRDVQDKYNYEQAQAVDNVTRSHRGAITKSIDSASRLFPDAGREGSELQRLMAEGRNDPQKLSKDNSGRRAETLPRISYKINEAAKIVGVSPITIRRAIERGLLKPCRAFRHPLILAEQLSALLKGSRNEPCRE